MMYKLVKVRHSLSNTKFMSACSGEFSLIYQINKETVPIIPNSKLFVFNCVRDAVDFWLTMSYPEDFMLFECNADNPEVCTRVNIIRATIRRFWQGIMWDSMPPPRGTYMADAVTLLRPVKPSEIDPQSRAAGDFQMFNINECKVD